MITRCDVAMNDTGIELYGVYDAHGAQALGALRYFLLYLKSTLSK
jgi:hypothetical protein